MLSPALVGSISVWVLVGCGSHDASQPPSKTAGAPGAEFADAGVTSPTRAPSGCVERANFREPPDARVDGAFADHYRIVELDLAALASPLPPTGFSMSPTDRSRVFLTAATATTSNGTNVGSGVWGFAPVYRTECSHVAGFGPLTRTSVALSFAAAPVADGNDVFLVSESVYGLLGGFMTKVGAENTGCATESTWEPLTDPTYGLALVPNGHAREGEVRGTSGATWFRSPLLSAGHGGAGACSRLVTFDAPVPILTLPRHSYGIAYVPAASEGFATASVLVSEDDGLAVYDIDESANPISQTRRVFARVPSPLGAFFDPEGGDLLVASRNANRVFAVHGFGHGAGDAYKPPVIK